ncbi:hypothetical protein LCGC14_1253160 [marine sediment metagenome]|uniref:Uncharacterized protein n=1 Tax=marine sediment metagenome TaxID=412755 RepID=A0A0F9P6B7_9ZZZZ
MTLVIRYCEKCDETEGRLTRNMEVARVSQRRCTICKKEQKVAIFFNWRNK